MSTQRQMIEVEHHMTQIEARSYYDEAYIADGLLWTAFRLDISTNRVSNKITLRLTLDLLPIRDQPPWL